MKRSVATIAGIVLVCLTTSVFAVDSKKAVYVGGTVTNLGEQVEGRLVTTDETILSFVPDKKKLQPATIRYSDIVELEYGQKAGRRVGVAIAVNPIALFSKKRNHFLTISYKDPLGKEQAAVFEIGKDIVRTTLKVLETRSGHDVKFQDDEARKSIGGGK
jgi:hypothetical protein